MKGILNVHFSSFSGFNRRIDRNSRWRQTLGVFWVVISCLAGVVSTPLQAQRDWKILPLFQTDSFDCQLRYLEVAGPADTLWMEPIFINHTSRPLKLGHWQIALFADEVVETGTNDLSRRAVHIFENQAFLGQANRKMYRCDYDRFDCIPPGDTLFAGRILSEHVSAGLMDDELGKPQQALEYPDRYLRATINVSYNDMINAVSFQTEYVNFYFRWNAVRASDLPILTQRLEHCLQHVDLSANATLLEVLLSDPRLSRQITLEKYMAVFIGVGNPFNRQTLLSFLIREHADDPMLRQYVLEGIQKRAAPAIEFIQYGYWNDDFAELLIATIDSTPFFEEILYILNRRPELLRNRQDWAARLSQEVFKQHWLLQHRDSLNAKMAWGWANGANALAMTLDTSVIAYLEGALHDTTRFKSYTRLDFDRTPPFMKATRVCDVAFEAICRIKGIDVQKRYYEASGLTNQEIYRYLDDFKSPQSLNNTVFIDAVRDKVIARYLAEK